MSAAIISDPMLISSTSEVEFATCECCGFTEECTPAYIERIRETCHGKWICGLCSEAVKDEILRSTTQRLIITPEEAMARHMNFCKKFVSSGLSPPDPTLHLISAISQILKRSLDSPRGLRSEPTTLTDCSQVQAGGLDHQA